MGLENNGGFSRHKRCSTGGIRINFLSEMKQYNQEMTFHNILFVYWKLFSSSYVCCCSKVNFTLSSSWYIGSVTWATESVLSVAWLPRSQTSIYYSLCPPPLYHCKTVSVKCIKHVQKWTNVWIISKIRVAKTPLSVKSPRSVKSGFQKHHDLPNTKMRPFKPSYSFYRLKIYKWI